MLKLIKQLLQAAHLDPDTHESFTSDLRAIEDSSKNTVQLIVNVCNLLMKRILKEVERKEYLLSITLLNITREMILRVRNEDVFAIQLVKIKFFILTLKLSHLMGKGVPQAKKIKLFLQTVEANIFFPLIQEDFMSCIQLVYLEGVKASLEEGMPQEALKMGKSCFGTLKRQLMVLVDLSETYSDDKMKRIVQKKGKTLESLFFLQHGARIIGSDLNSDQVLSSMLPPYEKLFRKIGFYQNLEQLVGTSADLRNPNQSYSQSLEQIPEQQERVEEKKRPTIEMISQDILKSMQFIAQIQTKPRSSAGLGATKPRISINIEEEEKNRMSVKSNATKESRFHLQSLKKENCQVPSPIIQSQVSSDKSSKVQFRTKRISSVKQPQTKQRAFSLVLRAEQETREKLKLFNPFKEIKQQTVPRPSSAAMIQSGVFSFPGLY